MTEVKSRALPAAVRLTPAAEARVAQPVLAKTTPNTARPAGGPKGGPEGGLVAAE